jgi:hypothetical protein
VAKSKQVESWRTDVYAHISRKLEQRNVEEIEAYKSSKLGGVSGAPNE